MALTNKLSAIGDAIRNKTGKSDLLTLEQMPTEINSIETGGSAGGLDFSKLKRATITASAAVTYNAGLDLSNYITNMSQIKFMVIQESVHVTYGICHIYMPDTLGKAMITIGIDNANKISGYSIPGLNIKTNVGYGMSQRWISQASAVFYGTKLKLIFNNTTGSKLVTNTAIKTTGASTANQGNYMMMPGCSVTIFYEEV